MDTKTKIREAAASWTGPQMQSPEQASAEVARTRSEAETALRALGRALLADAQVHVSSALTNVKRRVDGAETDFELLVSRVPLIGPRFATEMFVHAHPTREDRPIPTRPSNLVDPDDLAREEANSAAEYLDCIGVHVA